MKWLKEIWLNTRRNTDPKPVSVFGGILSCGVATQGGALPIVLGVLGCVIFAAHYAGKLDE